MFGDRPGCDGLLVVSLYLSLIPQKSGWPNYTCTKTEQYWRRTKLYCTTCVTPDQVLKTHRRIVVDTGEPVVQTEISLSVSRDPPIV